MSFNNSNLFTWNDLAIIKQNAPSPYPSSKPAVVCGMELIKSEKLSREFGANMGERLYTIEFGDGSLIEVPERYLEVYKDKSEIEDRNI